MKIDLQVHTTYSDGRNTPKEIIKLTKEGGLDIIAITDHDTISGVKESIIRGRKVGIKVIPAVEISVSYKNIPLHVLGYNIDINNKSLKEFLQNINKYRKKHFTKQISRLNQNLKKGGKKLVSLRRYSNKKPEYYSIPGLALFLYEEKIVKGRNDGFYYLLGIPDVAPPVKPKDAFAIINKAGGKAILSHPLAPLLSLKNITKNKTKQEKIISEFKRQGMDGLECYTTGHNFSDINFVLQLSKKYNLLISGGSDWHGSLSQTGETIKNYLPNYLNKLGGLFIPKEKVEEILKGLLII